MAYIPLFNKILLKLREASGSKKFSELAQPIYFPWDLKAAADRTLVPFTPLNPPTYLPKKYFKLPIWPFRTDVRSVVTPHDKNDLDRISLPDVIVFLYGFELHNFIDYWSEKKAEYDNVPSMFIMQAASKGNVQFRYKGGKLIKRRGETFYYGKEKLKDGHYSTWLSLERPTNSPNKTWVMIQYFGKKGLPVEEAVKIAGSMEPIPSKFPKIFCPPPLRYLISENQMTI